MTGLLILGSLWVLTGAVVAMLPMRHQYVPGVALVLSAPALIILFGYHFGTWAGVLAALIFVSMFRTPLRYIVGLALSRAPDQVTAREVLE